MAEDIGVLEAEDIGLLQAGAVVSSCVVNLETGAASMAG